MNFNDAKQVATTAILNAGQYLMQYWKQSKPFTFKAKQDIVSQIDLEVEQIIIKIIKENFPQHQILSEERGFIGNENQDFCWIIDPIDGTINFVNDAAPFRIGICLLHRNQPVLTTILNPIKNELYIATNCEPSTCNNERIRVSDNENLQRAVVMTHLSSKTAARSQTLQAINQVFEQTLHLRMFGSGLSALTYVASGKFDIFFNVKTNPWDILPGVLLVEQAGGKITDLEGNPITMESTSVLATNGKLQEPMLALLQKAWDISLLNNNLKNS
jgi:myo-inositol-1(or 4)-monophosphatase